MQHDPLEGTYAFARKSYDSDCSACLYDLHQCYVCNDVVSHDHDSAHTHDSKSDCDVYELLAPTASFKNWEGIQVTLDEPLGGDNGQDLSTRVTLLPGFERPDSSTYRTFYWDSEFIRKL